jgi:hypothetical protein
VTAKEVPLRNPAATKSVASSLSAILSRRYEIRSKMPGRLLQTAKLSPFSGHFRLVARIGELLSFNSLNLLMRRRLEWPPVLTTCFDGLFRVDKAATATAQIGLSRNAQDDSKHGEGLRRTRFIFVGVESGRSRRK